MISIIIFLVVLLLIAALIGQVKKVRRDEGPISHFAKKRGIV